MIDHLYQYTRDTFALLLMLAAWLGAWWLLQIVTGG